MNNVGFAVKYPLRVKGAGARSEMGTAVSRSALPYKKTGISWVRQTHVDRLQR